MANRTDRTPSPSPLTLRATSPATLAKSEAAYRTDQLSLVPTNKGEKSTYLQGETRRSLSKQTITLKIANSDEQMVVPGVVSTTCQEVTTMLSDFLMVPEHQITISRKTGPYVKRLMQHQQVGLKAIVGGIKSFSPQKKKWSHPIGIIGAGYNGLKTAMTYSMDNDENYVIFDRNDKVGGYCWITGANKTSRLQTELGSFHLWWGQHCINSGKMNYPDCNRHPMNWMRYDADAHDPEKDGWSIWPYKWEIQRMFHVGAEKFGILPHVRFQTNCSSMAIQGEKNSEDRYYKLMCESVKDINSKDIPTTSEVNVSVIYHFPGSLTRNRIIIYPGEDDFGGQIGYGMNDDTPYEKLANSNIAILGNGAFAVENARTCLECGGLKAYIVCRRKNLASPRMPCWFVHQAPLPVPGSMLVKMFEPMYKISGFEDPWSFWSVHANQERSHCSLIQNSRFGIGDVTFLMHAWGLLEYKQGVVKRMSHRTLHLDSGEKIENVNVVLKALGLLGDYAVDKLHNMKEIVGRFCGGDWRRIIHIDSTGMNASNFSTFSIGIAATDLAITYKFLYDYPKEFYKMEDADFMRTLPRHKAEPEIDKPVYVTEVRHDMSTSFTLDGMCPKLFLLKSWMGSYKHKMYHITHGTERTLEVALSEWNKYQEEWKSRGIEHDYLPYPYTKESVQGWFDEFAEVLKLPFKTSADGPTDAELEVLGGDVGKAKEWGGGDASG